MTYFNVWFYFKFIVDHKILQVHFLWTVVPFLCLRTNLFYSYKLFIDYLFFIKIDNKYQIFQVLRENSWLMPTVNTDNIDRQGPMLAMAMIPIGLLTFALALYFIAVVNSHYLNLKDEQSQAQNLGFEQGNPMIVKS